MAKARKRRRRRRTHLSGGQTAALIVICTLLLFLVGAAAGIYMWLHPYSNYLYILPNVYCAGINLGGMTKDQAEKAIMETTASQSYSLEVDFPDGSVFYLKPDQQVEPLDAAVLAATAYEYGRTNVNNTIDMYRAVKAAQYNSYEIPVSITIDYDADDLRSEVEDMVEDITLPPTESTGTGDTNEMTVSVTPGEQGRSADTDKLYTAACAAFDQVALKPVQAEFTETGIDEEQLLELVDELYETWTLQPIQPTAIPDSLSHTIILTNGTPGYDFDRQALFDAALQSAIYGDGGTVTVNMEEVLPGDMDIWNAYNTIYSEPKEVEYHDGGLVGGQVGYVLDWQTAVDAAVALGWGESVTLQFEEVQPETTIEEVQAVLFRDTLGSHSTIYTNLWGRTQNLRLACQEIDGTVLNAGATFSFNTIVGERTADKGYQSAIVYVDGNSTPELGGGVCQVASTMYYTALLADMEIVDRAPHMFVVTYVPGGLDANVYWGLQDFCFKNNTNYPIRIRASVANGYVNIRIEGTNETGQYCTLSSNLTTSSDPEKISYQAYQYVYSRYGVLEEKRDLGISTYDRH